MEVATIICKHSRADLIDWNQIYDLVVHLQILNDALSHEPSNSCYDAMQDRIRAVRHFKIQTGLRSLDVDALRVFSALN